MKISTECMSVYRVDQFDANYLVIITTIINLRLRRLKECDFYVTSK